MTPPIPVRRTDAQDRVLDEITRFTRINGFSPTVRELGERLSLASPSTVHMHLNALRSQGRVQWNERSPRTLRVVDQEVSS